MIPPVVASDRGTAQTVAVFRCRSGVVGPRYRTMKIEQKQMEICAIAGESPLCEVFHYRSVILSSAGHVKSCVNPAGPSAKAKYS